LYPLKYVSGSGRTVIMGRGTPFTITKVDGLDGVETDIETSQGFEQVGETIDTLTTGGNTIKVYGRCNPFCKAYGDALVNTILPMSTGRLYFADKFWIDVAVKNAPAIAQALRKATFNFRLYAPYPYWKSVKKNVYKLGGSLGGFRFPVNYATPHHFGQRSATLFLNCVNNGNVKTDFRLTLYAKAGLANVTITNAQTQEFIGINTEMQGGDYVYMFRENNQLRCIRDRNGVISDIFSDVDEDTDLFFMNVGDNVLRSQAESGGNNLIVQVDFYDTKSGVFYGM
jgi:hypothetical protein